MGAYHFLTTSSSAEKQFGNFKRADEEFDKAMYNNFKTCAGIAFFNDYDDEKGVEKDLGITSNPWER